MIVKTISMIFLNMEAHLNISLQSIRTLLKRNDVLCAYELLFNLCPSQTSLSVQGIELDRVLVDKARQEYWQHAFMLFKDCSNHRLTATRNTAVCMLVHIANWGSHTWRGVKGIQLKWMLHIVEAWAQYIRCFDLESSFCDPSVNQHGAQDPHSTRLALPQPGLSVEDIRPAILLALENLIRRSCSCSDYTQQELSPGHEAMALHRHPDVLLCMKVVSWHETPDGKQLLAWSLMVCYNLSGEERSIMEDVEKRGAPMLVMDEEESTSRDSLDLLASGFYDKIFRQDDDKDPLLVIVVIGRVLLPRNFAFEWCQQSHLRLVFFGFQRWPVPKHYASLVSRTRDVALLFACREEGALSLLIRYLQLELVPPHQMTPALVKALKEIQPLPSHLDNMKGEGQFHLREVTLLECLDSMLLEELGGQPLLQYIANRLRFLKQQAGAAHRHILPTARGRFVGGQHVGDEEALEKILEPQQLVQLLESLQMPLRPAGLQAAKRKQVEEQEQELQCLLSTGKSLQEQLGLCSGPQLGSQRGQKLCGVLLRCMGLRCVDLQHCSFTGHGSLCSLFVAATCCSVAVQDGYFEGGGRGIELQCVRETVLRKCHITDCLLEGVRCSHPQELNEEMYPDLASIDALECESLVHIDSCNLSLLPGGGVVQCHGRLRLDNTLLQACGSSPKLAALAVCGDADTLHIWRCVFKACPHAAIFVQGTLCLASVSNVRIEGCGMGIVLEGSLEEASGIADGGLAAEQANSEKLEVLHAETRAEVVQRSNDLAERAWRYLEAANVVVQVIATTIRRCSGPAILLHQGTWLHAMNVDMDENNRQPRHFWQVDDIDAEAGGWHWYINTNPMTRKSLNMDEAIIESAKAEGSHLPSESSLPALVAAEPVATRGPLLLPHLLLTSTPCCTDLCARQARLNAAHDSVLIEVLVQLGKQKEETLQLLELQGSDVTEDLHQQLRSEDGSSQSGAFTDCPASEGNGCIGDSASSQSAQQEDSGVFHDMLDVQPGLGSRALLDELPDLEDSHDEDSPDGSDLFSAMDQQFLAQADASDPGLAQQLLAQYRRLMETMKAANELGPSSSS